MIVLPTYHPSYINRMRFQKGDSTTNLKYVWVADLRKAKSLVEGWSAPRENFNMFPTFNEARSTIEMLIERHQLIAVDIETTALDPSRGNIVVIGIAWSSYDALSIPLLCQGGRWYWSESDFELLAEDLRRLLRTCPQMYQNALYDLRWLRAKDYDPDLSLVVHDTLLLHHAISPELPHNLGFIVSTYGRTPYWKDTLRNRPGRILDMDDEDLRRYNLRDTVVLHQILPPMLEDLSMAKTDQIYHHESIPLITPVVKMIENGIKVNPSRLKQWKSSLESQLTTVDSDIRRAAHVPAAFNFSSDDDMRWLLFSLAPPKFAKISTLEGKKPGTKVYATLAGLKQIRDETRTFRRLESYSGRKTDSGRIAVDKQGLLSLQIAAQNRLASVEKFVRQENFVEEKAELKRLLEVIRHFTEYRKLEKLLSTYTDFPIDSDSRVRGNFKIHGTATGRLSCGG